MRSIILGLIVCAVNAQAGELLAPFGFDSAAVLPKGVRAASLRGFYGEIYNRADGNGTPVPVADSFNRDVTWNDVLKGMPSNTEKEKYQKYQFESLVTQNNNTTDLVGQTHGFANVAVTTRIPSIGWGVTDKWTIGFAIPVVTQDVNASAGFTRSASAQSQLDAWATNNQESIANTLAEKLANPALSLIEANGYEPVRSKTTNDVGDFRIHNRYLVFKQNKMAAVVFNDVTLPTGRRKNINDLTDIGTGDDQVDIGFGSALDYDATGWLKLNVAGSYTAQTPYTFGSSGNFKPVNNDYRIPVEKGQMLTPDVDDNVKADLGDIITAALGATATYEGFSFSGKIMQQVKYNDKFEGSKFDQSRYDMMGSGSGASLQTSTLGVAYSTIGLFRAGKFPVPLSAMLSASQIIDARNAFSDDIYGFNMSMYF